MTDGTALPPFGPLHPVTRLDRVLQQLGSFSTMHAAELAALAEQLETAGQPDLAVRLRTFADLQSQETTLIRDELADVRADLERQARTEAAPWPFSPPADPVPADPAANSPKRARWLAERAARANRPIPRRGFFTPGQ